MLNLFIEICGIDEIGILNRKFVTVPRTQWWFGKNIENTDAINIPIKMESSI